MKKYLALMRPDHWFKNVFALPGVAFASLMAHIPFDVFVRRLAIGTASLCLIASANYVINEWLDADYDRFHPVKRHRPSVAQRLNPWIVYAEYVAVLLAGVALASLVSVYFLAAAALLGIMGVVYNVPPFRSKDRAYLDVLSESINNPIRLLMGWFIVTERPLPPSSLLVGYWMGGAFLMGVKRYAEFRYLAPAGTAGLYRRSFQFYREETLLISSFFYAMCAGFFLGVFLVKYRIELLLGLPFVALLFAWYLKIGMKQDSAAQHPERLYHEKQFIVYVGVVVMVLTGLVYIDIPALKWFLNNAFLTESASRPVLSP
jgi:decaprenyl-phosphate phosphoribosyltransferase